MTENAALALIQPPVKADGTAVAAVSHLSLRYKRAAALDDVSLTIPAGIMAGFIGPDGVGKSSLFATIAGAREIQSGDVKVLGGDMRSKAHRSEVCPRIAYMPQGLGRNLYPDLSIRENIEFFGRLFGQSAAERGVSHRRSSSQHGPDPVRGSSCKKTVGRHAAETRPVLLAHS